MIKEIIIGIILGGIGGGIAGEIMRKFIIPRYPKLFKQEGDLLIDIIIKYFKKRKTDSSS